MAKLVAKTRVLLSEGGSAEIGEAFEVDDEAAEILVRDGAAEPAAAPKRAPKKADAD